MRSIHDKKIGQQRRGNTLTGKKKNNTTTPFVIFNLKPHYSITAEFSAMVTVLYNFAYVFKVLMLLIQQQQRAWIFSQQSLALVAISKSQQKQSLCRNYASSAIESSVCGIWIRIMFTFSWRLLWNVSNRKISYWILVWLGVDHVFLRPAPAIQASSPMVSGTHLSLGTSLEERRDISLFPFA